MKKSRTINKPEKNNSDSVSKLQKESVNSLPKDEKKILNSLPKDKKKEVMDLLKVTAFKGPIPPPQILKEYNEIDPGAGKQIIDNAIDESKFRRSSFKSNQKTGSHLAWAIMIFMFTLTVLLLYFSYLLLKNNINIGGTVFCTFGGLSGLTFLSTCVKSIEVLTDKRTPDNRKSKKQK